MLAYIERQCPLGVGHLRTGDCRGIARRFQAVLSLVAAFKQVAQPDVELLGLIQILAGKILRAEKRNELRIYSEDRIRSQVGRNFLGFILLNLGTGRL